LSLLFVITYRLDVVVWTMELTFWTVCTTLT